MNFLTGVKTLEEKDSKINGKVTVIKSIAWGTYLQVDGITQSGGVVKDIWRSTLKKIRNTKHEIRNVLILGLGGGSVASLIRKNWPDSKITGVDVDPVMVEMGRKYLGLDEVGAEIKIADAMKFVQTSKVKFDLIIIDLYQGRECPVKFSEEKFLKLVVKLLSSDGVAVFNRLYYDEKRREAMKFGENLQEVFPKVDYFYPEANVMFVCQNS